MYEQATQKRKDFLLTAQELKKELLTILGPSLTETIAATSSHQQIMHMSCQDIMQYLKSRYGKLTSYHVMQLTAALQEQLPPS